MLPRSLRTKAPLLRHSAVAGSGSSRNVVARRTLIEAPKRGGAPLMERRTDRELPDIHAPNRMWLKTAPLFIAILVGSAYAIFNYEKSSSSVVASTLYALRTSAAARAYLGDEIYFAQQMPWIWGSIDLLHGNIDIRFRVKGTRERAMMRFKSARVGRRGIWETEDWSLETGDGTSIDLLQDRDASLVPIEIEEDEGKTGERGSYAPGTSS